MLASFYTRLRTQHFAQQPSFEFDHISAAEGLSHRSVRAITQDSQGFMWIGTEEGLNRYDGYNFEVYKHDPHDTTSLSSDWISSVYESQSDENVLWIGTREDGGLYRFDRTTETFKRYLHDPSDPHSLSDNNIHVIHEDRSGTLWVGTGSPYHWDHVSENVGGLNRFDRTTETFKRYLHDPSDPHSLSSSTVLSIYEDERDTLWIGTRTGLNRFSRATETFTTFLPEPADSSHTANRILAIHEDPASANLFWLGTGDGLYQFDRDERQFRRFQPDPNLSNGPNSNFVLSIHEDRQGTLWIGTMFGLYCFDRSTNTFLPVIRYGDDPRDFDTVVFATIYESKEGVLWIGTKDGIFKRRATFAHYRRDPDDPNSLNHNYVQSFYEDASGKLWIGTVAGLNRLERSTGTFSHFVIDPSNPIAPANSIMAIEKAHDNSLWGRG